MSRGELGSLLCLGGSTLLESRCESLRGQGWLSIGGMSVGYVNNFGERNGIAQLEGAGPMLYVHYISQFGLAFAID